MAPPLLPAEAFAYYNPPGARQAAAERRARDGRAVALGPQLFRLGLGLDPALSHGFRELVQDRPAFFPRDATVGDADAILERLAGYEVLPARFQVAFHHDAENAVVAASHLARHVVPDVDLLR